MVCLYAPLASTEVTIKSAFPVLVSVTVCDELPGLTRLTTCGEKLKVDGDRLACCENAPETNVKTTKGTTKNFVQFKAHSPLLCDVMQR